MSEHDLGPGKQRLMEEYGNADNYDIGENDDGVDFYLDLARETGGPVLELGCGTGRVAIAMARAGLDVTGLDVVPGMLEVARRKSAGLSTRWIEADARDFALDEQFRLVFLTGNTFQAFLTNADQEAMLSCARRHLRDGGLLAFETRNPRWANMTGPDGDWRPPAVRENYGVHALLETTTEESGHRTYVDVDGRQVRESLRQSYDHVAQVLTWTRFHRWEEAGTTKTRVGHTSVRFTFPQELDGLLRHAGFEVVRRYGDWDRQPLSATSPSIIVVCRNLT